MYNIKKITSDTMKEFSQKIEYGKNNFIPMLPFIKMPFHDFDRYNSYNDKGLFLIDYLDEGYCLYHLYHLIQADNTLRATLILPSSWDKRFDLIEKSISNIKEWFITEDTSEKFIIQSLEYGEIEYYPTLSQYLIPTIIRNGFEPKYRMYMKRQADLPVSEVSNLKEGLELVNYSDDILEDIVYFYYKNESIKNLKYFTNCTYDEFLEMLKQDFTINNAKFIKTTNGSIIAGIIPSLDSEKVWIDNFTVHPDYDNNGVNEYILGKTIKHLSKSSSEDNVYIYLNRDCQNAISACEKNGFAPFEFWVDMILER
ncbi:MULTISPECIES: GNAT family N-acetyltransferase [Clostridium]|uniref:GNAT family N-acetyltransferase n=1 Tax=Clostridium TaxID=1485 RepID=UPI0013E9666E|nr:MULTISPECIES: GNAT family N-acetyltransferase [Clostridium]MBW9158929.1 GNAT family N-acetyltransferase [Clostridium tagluense]MBZ9624871.1 GNAT family N-acetyltransferase [Clostridium sp. FP2]MBZ9636304.1 GNAT family N-acetyltransferase [Clostridium sp. FP1]WLC64688.1 GNAT family N-acetyltransferase [Clostridium tagluense]